MTKVPVHQKALGHLGYVIISDVTTGEILVALLFHSSGLEAGGLIELSGEQDGSWRACGTTGSSSRDGPERVGEQGSPHTQVLQTASLKDGPAKRVWVRRNHSEPGNWQHHLRSRSPS